MARQTPVLAVVFGALAFASGCSSSTPRAASAPVGNANGPYAVSAGPIEPLRPIPPPSPAAALAALSGTIASQVADLPCPPPGLPPELAARIDCAAMKRFTEASMFAPRDLVSGTLPASIDLRQHGLAGPTKSQEQVGACAGFAMSTVMDNAARRLGRSDVIAPLHVFATYSGAPDFSAALKNKPMTIEPVFPYTPQRGCKFANSDNGDGCMSAYGVPPGTAPHEPAILAEKARADASGHLEIIGYEEMPHRQDQLAVVLASGEAIYAAFRFDEGAWNSLDHGGDVMPYYPADSAAIGHAVTLEGYRTTPEGRQFLLHNSWGTDWGRGGYAWMDASMVETHLINAYRVQVTDPAMPAMPSLSQTVGAGWPQGWPTSLLPPGVSLPSWTAGAANAWPAALPAGWPSSLPTSQAELTGWLQQAGVAPAR
ncbi:MAG TPA: C1 family peptidase [Polyangiaceae bacterium]|nr:C1 family peptidase [Polyangiaceae bacterium]